MRTLESLGSGYTLFFSSLFLSKTPLSFFVFLYSLDSFVLFFFLPLASERAHVICRFPEMPSRQRIYDFYEVNARNNDQTLTDTSIV